MHSQTVKMFILYMLLTVLSACSLLKTSSQDLQNMKLLAHLGSGSNRIAIMPFKNSSSTDYIGTQVRSSFYNHLSSKAYTDIELFDIDAQITALENAFKKPWQQISPRDIGTLMNADFIIYGEVIAFNKQFLGIYSQQAISLHIRMIETKSGQTFLSERIVKRSHEGGLPLNPFSLIASFFLCGLEMRSERTVALIDKTCRSLVMRIPDPVLAPPPDNQFALQLASFQHKSEAERLVKRVRLKGLMPHLEIAAMTKKTWYRVILGPYSADEAKHIKPVVSAEFELFPIMIPCSVQPA